MAKKFVEEKLVTLYLALLQSLFKAPSELERVGDLFLRNFLSSKAFIVSLVLCTSKEHRGSVERIGASVAVFMFQLRVCVCLNLQAF